MSTESAVNWFDRDVFKVLVSGEVCQQYNQLAERLYDVRRIISLEQFLELLDLPTQLLVFRTQDMLIVSMAEATLVPVRPNRFVLVSNVITREGHDGCGHYQAVMEALFDEARRRWGKVPFLRIQNQKKDNLKSYPQNGWVNVDTLVYAYLGE